MSRLLLSVPLLLLFTSSDAYAKKKDKTEKKTKQTQSAPAELSPLESSVASIEDGRILLDQKIEFEFDSDILQRDSVVALRELARLLNSHPEISLLEVRGHTDTQGSAGYNLDLSQRRADEVARFLTQYGVSSGRILAHGYGESRPLLNGHGEHVHEINRRVEFVIVKS